MVKHINITDDIKNKINDFLNGDDKYWKNQYNKVINEFSAQGKCIYCKTIYLLRDKISYNYPDGLCPNCCETFDYGGWCYNTYFCDWYKGRIQLNKTDVDKMLKYEKIRNAIILKMGWINNYGFFDEVNRELYNFGFFDSSDDDSWVYSD